jgi:hypothetical protein
MMPMGMMALLRLAIGMVLPLCLVTDAGPQHVATPSRHAHTELTAPPVQVFLYKDTKPGAITYGYRVVNGSAFQISTLMIGFNHFLDAPELRIAPTGWDGTNVPAANFRSPTGWKFEVTQTEEDSLINLQWQVDSLTTGLVGGATLGGFEVTVAQEDTRYADGHWTVYLKSAQQDYFTGAIDASGTTSAPPSSIFGHNGVKVRPNPTHAGVIIEFSSPASGVCTIDILDAAGRSVRRMTRLLAVAGALKVEWDGLDSRGRRASPASYFVRIQTPKTERYARFVLER